MSKTKPARVLPADVYDALEFSALVEGGIGGGRMGIYVPSEDRYAPNCIYGHADALDEEARLALRKANISASIENDSAVAAINRRKGTGSCYARVPFADWCAEVGVERGL